MENKIVDPVHTVCETGCEPMAGKRLTVRLAAVDVAGVVQVGLDT